MNVAGLEDQIRELGSNLRGDYTFSPRNVYQEGCPPNREIIGRLADLLMLPGSRIDNVESLVEFHRRGMAGESCLLLAEHYSNLDFPTIYRLIEREPALGPSAAETLLPIRGMKLTETTPITAVFARSYDTIVIYPSRSLDKIRDPEELRQTRKISVPINHAAIKEVIQRKHNGRMILVFPAGTRYRPWDPDTRRGVREIYSYLKTFDNVMFLAVNGNTLPPCRSEDMTQDEAVQDLMILTCSDIISGRRFRKEEQQSVPEGKDPKQHVVDRVMEELFLIHERVEPIRLREKASISDHVRTDEPFSVLLPTRGRRS